ncbi:MAG: DUF3536 domain-containing protein [Candidatus Omnitrophica bacterium]|nr:DUF3536 domain-containing protein [Candidatus Omnitrophota bacterium]MBU4478650.1 DUF3536 domain-containing protein [Candidatus Omnitrophota bacterium]
MNKHICIHGHFYQPPRENPWLEAVEQEDSAYPYHDWNEKITAECYAPNSLARILGPSGKIINIINNYANISFNFGPTLLSWMDKNDQENYQAILNADKESQKAFSGHGSAIAQCYNHMIMPLANSRDKYTQVLWGLKDFEHRFGRKPEGMWLPETAVDLETLDILAGQGMKFTILAPRQAKRVRKLNDGRWKHVSEGKIDPRYPYRCNLPSGRTIVLFFYDGPISQGVAFEKLLLKGEYLADRMVNVFTSSGEDQLVHIATDGETYGHHREKADMALAYCLNYIRENNLARVTIYGEYLEHHPPQYEVEIHENSSWSCVHGIERWRNNCGCCSGMHWTWNQEWRAPLRGALDWLRDNAIQVYEEQMKAYVQDPWQARNEYVDVILNRTDENVTEFFNRNATHALSAEERTKALQLLELQRYAMLMYTSCGWFFDEVSGIETVQILQYAARVIQLVKETTNMQLEETFVALLEKVPSNIGKYQNGRYIYENFVKPRMVSLLRVGAHYAISSLSKEHLESNRLYCYTTEDEVYDFSELGKQKLACGKVRIISSITKEQAEFVFAVLHLGDHNFLGGITLFNNNAHLKEISWKLKEAFKKSDIAGTISLIESYFNKSHYNLWHLFKDEQMKVLDQVLESTLKDVESSLRQINERYYPVIQVIRQFNKTLPKVLSNTLSATINADIIRVLNEDTINFNQLEYLVSEIKELSLDIDKITLGFLIRRRVNRFMSAFEQNLDNTEVLEIITKLLAILEPLSLEIDFWKAQNIYFSVRKKVVQKMKEDAQNGNIPVQKWLTLFNRLGDNFKVWTG